MRRTCAARITDNQADGVGGYDGAPSDAPSSPREHDEHTGSLLDDSPLSPAEPTANTDTSDETSSRSDTSPESDDDGRDDEASSREALHSSETDEWHTPSEYIEAARDVLGHIDLDPASSPAANERIQADDIYTRDDDGLEQFWFGNVWLNPPYGRHPETHESNQAVWSRRLLETYEDDDEPVRAAILLVNATPDRDWFQPLWHYPICFPSRRIRFLDEGGEAQASPTHGNAFIYLGNDPWAFAELFSEFGPVVTAMCYRDDKGSRIVDLFESTKKRRASPIRSGDTDG